MSKESRDIAILIDCWDHPNELYGKLFSNINDFVEEKQDSLHSVIAATYDKKNLGELSGKINVRGWRCPTVDMEQLPVFLEYIKELDIGNIWYAGAAWNKCIKDRPLGWENLQYFLRNKNPNGKILFRENCILASRFGIGEPYWPDLESETMTPVKRINLQDWQLTAPIDLTYKLLFSGIAQR